MSLGVQGSGGGNVTFESGSIVMSASTTHTINFSSKPKFVYAHGNGAQNGDTKECFWTPSHSVTYKGSAVSRAETNANVVFSGNSVSFRSGSYDGGDTLYYFAICHDD